MSQQQEENIEQPEGEDKCPSCGRYVGAHSKCPYCGTNLKKRLSIRIMKIFALAFSVIGLIGLYVISRHTEIPRVNTNEISTTMNFAYVRVKGKVTKMPSKDLEEQYLSFQVADTTGEISVRAYGIPAKELIEKGKVPRLGDTVDVSGTINIKQHEPSLLINLAKAVEISPAEARRMSIDSINRDDENAIVTTKGTVTKIKDYDTFAEAVLTSREGPAQIPLAIDKTAYDTLPILYKGDVLKVTGLVSVHRGAIQIRPSSYNDISIVEKSPNRKKENYKVRITPPPKEVAIKNLSEEMIGEKVKITGEITQERKFSAGRSYTLKQEGNFIRVVLWNKIYKKFSRKKALKEGTKIFVTGEVDQYKDKLQVLPEEAEDISIVSE